MGLFDKAVMVQIDFGGNPHTVRVAANFLEAVCFPAAGENDDFGLGTFGTAIDKQRFVVLEFAPAAAALEEIFQPQAIALAQIQLGGAQRRSRCQMNLIRRGFQFLAEGIDVIYRFAGTNRPFCDIEGIVQAAPDIVLMLLAKLQL